MYINPFIAGVITTVLVELLLFISFSIYLSNRKK